MNTLIILAILGGGPFGAAINQADWKTVPLGDIAIDLPIPKAVEYVRSAPANYRIAASHWSKSVPVWCPAKPERLHGYNCGMHKTVEDLAGHLQTVHGVQLEKLNKMGRENWQSYHEDLHWRDETDKRQEQFLHPKPTCGPNGCPSSSGYSIRRGRGFF